MKCQCGFDEQAEDNLETKSFPHNGGTRIWHDPKEKFIHIKGMFRVDTPYSYHTTDVAVSLYACPKCKTVQMED